VCCLSTFGIITDTAYFSSKNRFFYKKFSHEDTKARIIFNRGLTQISTDLFLATEFAESAEIRQPVVFDRISYRNEFLLELRSQTTGHL